MSFWRFVEPDTHPASPISGTHDPFLVLLSVAVACVAALAALAAVDRMRLLRSRSSRLAWLVAGGLAMGSGTWAMHFTGMLAFSLPVNVSYGLRLTLVSMLPALLSSGLALRIICRPTIHWRRLHAGGLLLAAGIVATHYTGMEAMHVDALKRYELSLFVLSIGVAHLLTAIALHLRFVSKPTSAARFWVRQASAVVMGGAVAGMHYTAMAAVRFYPAPGLPHPPEMILPPIWMAVFICAAVSLITGLTLVGAAIDRRLTEASDSAAESAIRQRSVLETMVDGVITFDRRGVIESLNPAAERMFGYDAREATGNDVRALIPALSGTMTSVKGVELQGQRRDGSVFPLELSVSEMQIGERLLFSGVVRDIKQRKDAELELRRLATAVEQTEETILITDLEGKIQYVNPAFEKITGCAREEAIGQQFDRFQGVDRNSEEGQMWSTLRRGEVWSGCCVNRRADGATYEVELTISPVRDGSKRITNFVAVKRDVTEKKVLQAQLSQAQKLESIGQLAAGIAHEINTPTQYVGDNTRFLQDAFGDLIPLLKQFRELLPAARSGRCGTEAVDETLAAMERADLDYLTEEIPRAIQQSLEGVERVSRIVRAMKEFSHPSQEKTLLDVNRAIESTITVATSEWKYVAEMELDLDPELPPVLCRPGEFNQVILNIVVNAAHAIGDVVRDGSATKGTISVVTRKAGGWAEISIGDTGTGIPEQIRGRIFEPFFTTKKVGKGTGQGLSIAHSIVVQEHGGKISVESQPGRGTRFLIQLPVADPAADEAAVAEEVGA